MKTSILLTAALAFSFTASATVLTVSNDPTNPAQYTDVQVAIDLASPLDTILITPGTYGSQNISLAKPLTVIGAGSVIDGIHMTSFNTFAITAGANGSQVSGFDAYITLDGVSNITISRVNARIRLSPDVSDVVIKHSMLSLLELYFAQNIVIRNSLITGGVRLSNQSSVIFNNDYFGNTEFLSFTDCTISNSIIIGEQSDLDYYLNTFTNNLSFQIGGFPIPNTGSSSSNLNNQDPLFVIPVGGFYGYKEADFHLQPGSPAIAAGIDGVDLGIYGGLDPMPTTTPWQMMGKPRLPEVIEFNVLAPTPVPQSGALNIEVKAVNND